ncbi:MAG: hypothetical protein WAU69_10255 [Solirubrobacteraceae bacterium]
MAITTLKTERLIDAGLDDFFSKNKAHWLAHAKRAFDYMAQLIAAQDIHPDDLIPILEPALELDTDLRDFLDESRLGQKYWFTYFGEYIVDEVWGGTMKEER